VKFAIFFQARFEGYPLKECLPGFPSMRSAPCLGEDIAAVTSNQVEATKPRKKR